MAVNSDSNDFTSTTPNTTSFSVAIFSSDPVANASSPFFYQYHHAASNVTTGSSGMDNVDADSVYNVARVTTVFTVFAFLVAVGDAHWLEPVTQYIPELASHQGGGVWHDVRLIDLASNLAGIARDTTSDSLSGIPIPEALASVLPNKNTEPVEAFLNSQEDLLHILAKRHPVYLPSSTPIYSNAAFQLLALAIERVTGTSFDEILEKSIFGRLNMTLSTLGTPKNDTNAVIPTNEKASGWDEGRMNVSSLLAANFMYSTIYDLSAAGRAILKSLLLSPVSTNRWLKPISQTSNAADDVGVPFDIYRATLTGTSIGALTPIYTQFGTQGLYSSYFGLAPDWGVGFTILSADTTAPADLNAYVDLMVEHLLPALEKTAMQQAILNYAGRYTAGDVQLLIKVDGSSGLSLTNWTIGSQDIRAAFAELNSIPPATLDFRLYPTNLVNDAPYGGKRAFRAVLQDKAAPADAGTPTCITWMAGVDKFVFNGFSLDEFVFEIDQEGTATGVEVPALDLALRKK